MADDKLKTGPESLGPSGPDSTSAPEVTSEMGDAPAAPSGKVIDLTAARAASEKSAEAPTVETGSPKRGEDTFRDLSGNEEKEPWEKTQAELDAEAQVKKGRGVQRKQKTGRRLAKRRKSRAPARAALQRLTRRPVASPRLLLRTKCPEVRSPARIKKRAPVVPGLL